MRQTIILFTLSLAVILLLGFISNHPTMNDPDPILESFERELNHEPSPAPGARRDEILEDELYKTLNSVHWTRNDEDVVETEETNLKSVDVPDDK